jgi:hypothetical protein
MNVGRVSKSEVERLIVAARKPTFEPALVPLLSRSGEHQTDLVFFRRTLFSRKQGSVRVSRGISSDSER